MPFEERAHLILILLRQNRARRIHEPSARAHALGARIENRFLNVREPRPAPRRSSDISHPAYRQLRPDRCTARPPAPHPSKASCFRALCARRGSSGARFQARVCAPPRGSAPRDVHANPTRTRVRRRASLPPSGRFCRRARRTHRESAFRAWLPSRALRACELSP